MSTPFKMKGPPYKKRKKSVLKSWSDPAGVFGGAKTSIFNMGIKLRGKPKDKYGKEAGSYSKDENFQTIT